MFTCKSLTGAESRYSNIEHEALGIIHGLEKFHHYCFGRNVIIFTDHKPLIAIFKKDVATLSQPIQRIMLKIYQYHLQIIYKPGPQIFIADWLSRQNHKEGKDRPIQDIGLWVNAIQAITDLPKCISIPEMQQASSQDDHLQLLQRYIIAGWPDTRDKLSKELKPYWAYRDELAVTDGIIIKGKHIIVPCRLRKQVLEQLHTNHMGTEKYKITCLGINLLAQHKCQYRKIHKTMPYILK